MKFLPFALAGVAASLLVSCGPKPAAVTADKQNDERLAEEHQAQQERAVHEREAALDERERLLNQREQVAISPTPAEQPQPQQPAQVIPMAVDQTPPALPSGDATYQTFYDSLAQYGSWIELPSYGYVWQPAATVQDPAWRPYTVGHWVFTDRGWTWMSDEPFGWATYHYGRWMRTGSLGWVWAPGDEWAPAWVSWRFGNDFVGWAPLPPEARFSSGTVIQQWADKTYSLGADDYTFVPAADFGDANMAAAEAPPDEYAQIYDDSTNITNIYYDTTAYVIMCWGPNYDFIRTRCRRPLPPPLKIVRGGFVAGGNIGAAISGGELHIAAPRIREAGASPTPRLVRGRINDGRAITRTTASAGGSSATSTTVNNGYPVSRTNGAAMPVVRPAPSAPPRPVGFGGQGAVSNPAVQGGAMRIPSKFSPVPLTPGQQQQLRQEQPPNEGQQRQQAEPRAAEQRPNAEEKANAERAAGEKAAADRASAAQQAAAEHAAAERAAAEHAAAEHAAAEHAAAERAAAEHATAQRAEAEHVAAQQQAAREAAAQQVATQQQSSGRQPSPQGGNASQQGTPGRNQ